MISIFSKFKIAGGSERRCVELANGLCRYTDNQVQILCREKSFPDGLKKLLHPSVFVVTDCQSKPDFFYGSEAIITVNTDSRDFTKLSYWQSFLDTEKLSGKTMIFLFNFIISPSRHLSDFSNKGANVGIITTNKKFFDEVSQKDKFQSVRHLPRIILESPIDPSSICPFPKKKDDSFKIGMLSKSYGDKWNDDIPTVIDSLCGFGGFSFSLMGAKPPLWKILSGKEEVSLLREGSKSVGEFLSDLDLFMFFPSYKRQEPWARVIGEAMMRGLPILALDNEGGTSQQVLNGNNGFLCKNPNDFIDKAVYLFTNRNACEQMGKNSRIYAYEFTSENICRKLCRFMEGIKG